MSKVLLQTIDAHTHLYRDSASGIAWVVNGHAGTRHSAHPNIHWSGGVAGMKRCGYWGKDDCCVRCHSFIYNISHVAIGDDLDSLAAAACRCGGNHGEKVQA